MKESGLQDELRSFPKDHKLSLESIKEISTSIDNEIANRQLGGKYNRYKWRVLINRKKIAVGLLSLTLAGIVFWNIGEYDSNTQEQAGDQNHVANISGEEKNNIPNTSPENIYGTFEAQYSRGIDPKVPENLIIEGTSIVQLQVLSIGEAEMLPKTEIFYSRNPFTPIEVEIVDTIYGNTLTGNKTVYIQGGDIKISKFIKSREKESIDKMGLNELSQEEKDSKYLSFISEHDYKMKIGKEYMVILGNQGEDIYTVVASGYGIFDIEKTKSGKKIFKNVLTGKESDLQFSNVKPQ